MKRILIAVTVGLGIAVAMVGLLTARAAPPPAPLPAQDDAPSGYGWVMTTVEENITSFGGYTSLALDGSGYPHISYYDDTWQEQALKYAYWNGSAWVTQTVDSEGRGGKYTSLALEPTAPYTPHISYSRYRDGADDDLMYASWDGSAWVTETVDNAELIYDTVLALEPTAPYTPHIGYYDYYGSLKLKYASWNGSAWDIDPVDGTGNAGRYTSLALEPTAPYTPHMSCWGNWSLMYISWNGSTWVTETVDSEGSVGMYTSLALAPTAPYTPHISYYDQSNRTIKYATWDGSGWISQTVGATGPNYGMSSLALIPTTPYTPQIAYYDDAIDSLKYTTWDGSAWITETVEKGSRCGWQNSQALEPTAPYTPHVSYGCNGDLRYATWGEVITTDLTMTKTVQLAGLSTVTYTLVARNLGPGAADGAEVKDTLTNMTGAAWTCVAAGGAMPATGNGTGNVQHTLTAFPANGVVTCTISGTLVDWSYLKNTAEIVAPAGVTDTDEDNNTATVERWQLTFPVVFRNVTP